MSPARAAVALAVALLFAAATVAPAGAQAAPVLPDRVTPPPDDWLGAVNHFRTTSSLDPVVEEPAWTDGIDKHLTYLLRTPASLQTGPYANAHTENPESPWYTPEGAAAGAASNLGFGPNDREAIELWMRAPFHAIGILRPRLQRAAFALRSGVAGLDVIRGLGTADPDGPVLFPGPGSHNYLERFVGEAPDPTEPCGPGFTGLPLVAMLPDTPVLGTAALLRLPSGRLLAPGPDLCVVTAQTFESTDEVYGPTGRLILAQEDAVLVIPRQPLTPGRHDVVVSVPGADPVTWSFTQVASFDDVPADAYFKTPVRWLAANGITLGVTPDRFAPGDDVTRAQMAAFLHRFAGKPAPTAPLAFTDVPADAHYATAVRWLAQTGITTGVTPTRFAPGDHVTRAQMAAFLHRFDAHARSGGTVTTP